MTTSTTSMRTKSKKNIQQQLTQLRTIMKTINFLKTLLLAGFVSFTATSLTSCNNHTEEPTYTIPAHMKTGVIVNKFYLHNDDPKMAKYIVVYLSGNKAHLIMVIKDIYDQAVVGSVGDFDTRYEYVGDTYIPEADYEAFEAID